MKARPQLQLTRTIRLRGTFHAVIALCFAVGLTVAHTAPPSLQPLLQGKWPTVTRGEATEVKVVGNYAYVTLYGTGAGLEVIDVSNPANCVRVGGYRTGGFAYGVTVSVVNDNHSSPLMTIKIPHSASLGTRL